MQSHRNDSPRWPRLFLKILAATAALAALYLLVANAVVAAELRSLARDPRIELRYGAAYTLRPGRIHIDDLQLADRAEHRWRILVDRVDVRVDVLRLLVGALRVKGADAAVSAIEIGQHRLTGPMHARAEGIRSGPGARSVSSASLVIPGVEVRRDGAPAPLASIRGSIEAHGGAFSDQEGLQLTGILHLGGSDAGVLLDMAELPEAARWALEGIDGQAFTIDAAVDIRGDRLTLEDLRVDSDAAQVRGAFHRRGDLHQGAFLVRRGRLTTGIALRGDRLEVAVSPDEGWLSRQLDAMAGP